MRMRIINKSSSVCLVVRLLGHRERRGGGDRYKIIERGLHEPRM